MSQCFILRSDSGKTIGYIQRFNQVCQCKVCEEECVKRCDLYLLDERGSIHMYVMKNFQIDPSWESNYGALAGGAIVNNDKIVAYTGEDIKHLVWKDIARRAERGIKPSKQTQNRQEDRTCTHQRCRRRWPPNPCLPDQILEE